MGMKIMFMPCVMNDRQTAFPQNV